VIAITTAAAGLHHSVSAAHAVDGSIKYIFGFFGIWWAWMNYTWFASAYDNDDTVFRLLTMVIMAGSLTIAAGIGPFFESLDLTLVVIGYVVMRLAMVVFWLRAAAGDPPRRATARTYAFGIAGAQVLWVIFVWSQPLQPGLFFAIFAAGIVMELAVPVVAERREVTPWHRHHMIERYGLLNIIVLGETLLSATRAIEEASRERFELQLIRIAIAAFGILFCMWWLYFSREEQLERSDLSRAVVWGYGHFVIYASGAAVGAGIAVAVDAATGHGSAGILAASYAVAVPVAIYLAGLWLVRDHWVLKRSGRYVLPACAVIVLLLPTVHFSLEGITVALILAAVLRSRLACAEKEPNR